MFKDVFNLFIAFLRVGILGYGGGPSFIPLVEIEVVDNYRWMTTQEFTDALALGYALPGPIATKMAWYVGFKVAGWPGALSALMGIVAPSALAMIVLLKALLKYKDLPMVEGMLTAIRPVVVVLLVLLVVDMVPSSFVNVTTVLLGLAGFLAIQVLHVHPAIVVILALLFGALFLR